jgi:hypothetical protein
MRNAASKRLRKEVDAFVDRFRGHGYPAEEIAKALSEKLVDMAGQSYGVLRLLAGGEKK